MLAFIEARELRKTYRVGKVDVPALRGVSFSVQKGEFVSIVGPSGSGKSTLFHLLGGLTRADTGSVTIDGVDFATLSDGQRTRLRKSKIGFVFQKFNLLPTLSARSNIEIAVDIAGVGAPDPAFLKKITEMLAIARAQGFADVASFHESLKHNHNSKSSGIVLDMLRQSNKELGQTVLMITHNPEAANYGDRIVHMRDGEIVGPDEDPQWSPHHPVQHLQS